MLKIAIDRDLCIGCGNCESTAPEVFKVADDGIAVVIDPKGAEDNLIKEAAESCPVDAISLEDESGTKIYP